MSLFQLADVTLHSGRKSFFKIECDALTADDFAAAAGMLVRILPAFGRVEGVPRGGISLAEAMRSYITEGPLLIVDDVWTTGISMEAHRAGRDAIGAVIFGRGPIHVDWVTPLFMIARPLVLL